MRALVVCFGLAFLVATSGTVSGQDTEAPTPPAREHAVGDVPLEQGPEVTAEEPAPVETPSKETPAPAPETPAETAEERVTVRAVVIERPPDPPAEEKPVESSAAPDMTAAKKVAEEDLKATEAVPVEIETMEETPDAARPVEMQVAPVKPVRSTLTEVELVERIAVARESYRLSLEALKQHYVDAHNAVKLQWVEQELADLNGVEQYHYLEEVELAGEGLKPIASIAAADQLYREGMEFKNYPAFPPEKKDKLKIALQKLRTIISDYPTSDKIDDAAFRMGEIYEGWYFQDYARAVVCFERCFQWNPKTEYPARFNAAKLYDQRLMMRDKAVALYKQVVLDSQNPQHVEEALRRLNELAPKK